VLRVAGLNSVSDINRPCQNSRQFYNSSNSHVRKKNRNLLDAATGVRMKLIRLNTAPHDNGPPSVAPQTVNEPPRPFCKVPISLNAVVILFL
jgi:hypothetical protein